MNNGATGKLAVDNNEERYQVAFSDGISFLHPFFKKEILPTCILYMKPIHTMNVANDSKILCLLQRTYDSLSIHVSNTERHSSDINDLSLCQANARPLRVQRVIDLAFKVFLYRRRDKQQQRKV